MQSASPRRIPWCCPWALGIGLCLLLPTGMDGRSWGTVTFGEREAWRAFRWFVLRRAVHCVLRVCQSLSVSMRKVAAGAVGIAAATATAV